MPALFPTFQVLRYGGSEQVLLPAGTVAEEYEHTLGAKYGWYANDGFVFNHRFIPDFFQWSALEWTPTGTTYQTSGPRSVMCMRDLGLVRSLQLYVRTDYVDRTLSTPLTIGVVGTGYGEAGDGSSLEAIDQIAVAVFDPSLATQYLYVASDADETDQRDFGIPYYLNAELDATENFASGTQWAAGDTIEFDLPITTPFESLAAAFWIGYNNTSVGYRQTLRGIRINGNLFGVNQYGEEEPLTPQRVGIYTGDIWWQDLQNAEQSGIPGSTGVYKLPFSEFPGTYEEGYNEGYYNSAAYWSGTGQYDGSPTDQEYATYRDSFRVGMKDGLFDAIDEGGNPHNPTPSLAAQQYAERFATIDAQRDLVANGTYTDGQYYTVSPLASGYIAPENYADDDNFGPEMVDRYNGYYQGYVDGIAAGIIDGTYDDATGQVGNANYNASYATGYLAGWVAGGGSPQGGGEDPPEDP